MGPDGSVLRSRTTKVSGEFLLFGIPPGRYSLEAGKTGYPDYRVDAIQVASGSASEVVVEMERSGGANRVTVLSGWRGAESDPWAADWGSRFERDRMDDLPSARNVWALLQNQDPSSVTDHLDEGGFASGVLFLVGVHGDTWTQNGYRWDGLNINNPYDPGKPLAYPDYDSIQEFRVSGSLHAAGISSPGAEFLLDSRPGGKKLHGQAQGYYTGDPLQSSNLDSRLSGYGFKTIPHFERFPEGEFSLGGPAPHPRGWVFFTSLGFQHLSKVIPDFNGTPVTAIYSGIIRADRFFTRDDLSALVSGQIVRNSNLGAGAGIDPAATLHGNDRFEIVQGHWTHRPGDRSTMDLAFGFSHSSPTDTLQAGITGPSNVRLFTGETAGAAPVESDSALSRFSLRGQMETFRGNAAGLRHLLSFGADLEESLATEEQRVFDGLNLLLFPGGTPSEVVEFNSPSHAMQRLRELSLFAEDRLQISRRLFIRLGVNLDSSSAWLPQQTSGAGAFAPLRQFAGASGVVSWTTLSPRLSLTVPLRTPLGRTQFIAGYSRYYHALPAAYADYANPTALGGKVFRWNDRNGDGLFQPGEEGTLLRVFGGPYSNVDPNLKRPYTDEYSIGLEHDLGTSVQLSVQALERDSRRLAHTVNTGVPASAYTPEVVVDPGEDGILGTADDRLLTVYNQVPRTLGQDRYLLTNLPDFDARYRGIETALTARLAERGFFTISLLAYKSEGDGNPGNSVLENDPGVAGALFDNPNADINASGRLYFDRAYIGKIAAYYTAPFGFRLGTVISYFDGLPFGRELIIADFNQGPFFVMATPRGEPGGFRTQYNLNFDQRISREFELGKTRLTVLADVFNLLNTNKNLLESFLTGPQFSLRVPLDVQNPRAVRVGIRLSF